MIVRRVWGVFVWFYYNLLMKMNVLDIYEHTLSEMLAPGKREVSPVNIVMVQHLRLGQKFDPWNRSGVVKLISILLFLCKVFAESMWHEVSINAVKKITAHLLLMPVKSRHVTDRVSVKSNGCHDWTKSSSFKQNLSIHVNLFVFHGF